MSGSLLPPVKVEQWAQRLCEDTKCRPVTSVQLLGGNEAVISTEGICCGRLSCV